MSNRGRCDSGRYYRAKALRHLTGSIEQQNRRNRQFRSLRIFIDDFGIKDKIALTSILERFQRFRRSQFPLSQAKSPQSKPR